MGKASPIKAAIASAETKASRNSVRGMTLKIPSRSGLSWVRIASFSSDRTDHRFPRPAKLGSEYRLVHFVSGASH
jgi:hypothetical protein